MVALEPQRYFWDQLEVDPFSGFLCTQYVETCTRAVHRVHSPTADYLDQSKLAPTIRLSLINCRLLSLVDMFTRLVTTSLARLWPKPVTQEQKEVMTPSKPDHEDPKPKIYQ